ncbi:MAG: alpha/beta hydrolase [Spirochaetales bacterium]|nr:alpha/beta hydrolase [Candidatus Physcosoma equi]
MIHQTFSLDTGNTSVTKKATLTLYVLENYKEMNINRKRPMIVVCPGGGYRYCSPREAEVIAVRLNSFGYNAAVLNYNCAPESAVFPESLKELALAVAMVREHAEEWHTDKDKIAVMGFSAGGHLAASLGVFWHEEWLEKEMGMKKECYEPNALILAYPVITGTEMRHKGSFDNLLGVDSQEERDKVSLEKHVTKNVPPVFLWSTWTDQSVPIESSLYFASSLRKAGCSLELHIFGEGTHGLSTADEEVTNSHHLVTMPNIGVWPELLRAWLRSLWGTGFYTEFGDYS